MNNPLFKENIEDKEIRFKSPKEIGVINNKNTADALGVDRQEGER